MTSETYKLKDGRKVIISVNDSDYGVTVTNPEIGKEIGHMSFRYIEMPTSSSSDLLRLTYAFLDEVDGSYLRNGIGRRCLELVSEVSGMLIIAAYDDGRKSDDGSHLTGSAPGFINKMYEEGLIEYQ